MGERESEGNICGSARPARRVNRLKSAHTVQHTELTAVMQCGVSMPQS